MSVFGGDSWGREAQYRKRRVDDLLIEGITDVSSYKKLPNGKYACLVCPHNPLLDSPLALSMHFKGSRHLAAESRRKEREVMGKNEITKRLALSDSPVGPTNSNNLNKNIRLDSKPLIEQTRKSASEVLRSESHQQNSDTRNDAVKLSMGQVANVPTIACPLIKASDVSSTEQKLDFRERRERELKFIQAGWKRDCHGKWFKDENVEFDSDEEDPNICLA